MPRWRHLCKKGEEPSGFIGGTELREALGCKYVIGWSDIPREWLPGVQWLVAQIRKRWTVDGTGVLMVTDKMNTCSDILISQIKDKYGTLRFYFSIVTKYDDKWYNWLFPWRLTWAKVDKLVRKCEKRLAKDDPFYGEPY